MSVEQAVFALAGAVCVVGGVVAVGYRDPRVAGAALLLTLVSISALYATLAAPVVATLVIVITLVAVVPLVVHLTVPAPRRDPANGDLATAGATVVIAAGLLGLALVAVTAGELPLNVSVRSTDGYDLAGLYALAGGRMGAAAVASGAVVVSAIAAARSARRAP